MLRNKKQAKKISRKKGKKRTNRKWWNYEEQMSKAVTFQDVPEDFVSTFVLRAKVDRSKNVVDCGVFIIDPGTRRMICEVPTTGFQRSLIKQGIEHKMIRLTLLSRTRKENEQMVDIL